MSVTLVVCTQRPCGRMLNGELCHFVGPLPFCADHYAPIKETLDQYVAEEVEWQDDDTIGNLRGRNIV